MPLHKIKNEKILKFCEKLLGYPIEMIHVKGATHTLADRLSRYPDTGNNCSDLEERFTPAIASRSLRTKQAGQTPQDPHIQKIAELAKEDEDYTYIIKCI